MVKTARAAILAAVGLAIIGSMNAAAQPEVVEAAYTAAYEADAPVRNFVYLYLRAAGVVWVAVEWVAAVVLIRVYGLLHPLLTRKEG